MTAGWCFVLVDLTSDAGSVRPGPALPSIVEAVMEQISGPFADAWGRPPVEMRIASGPTDRASNEIAVNFRDTIPEAPGALAYHSVALGVPDIEIGVDLFSSLVDGPESISAGVSHEILELLIDPGANGWKDKGNGTLGAEEGCDPVQNTGYQASNAVSVANFVLPSYFIPEAPGPWDHLEVMAAADDLSHGYEIQAASPTSITQADTSELVGAAHHHGQIVYTRGELSEVQRHRKSHPYSRTYRRGVRLGALL